MLCRRDGPNAVVQESELIELLLEECSASARDWLTVGPGDDAAEVELSAGSRMELTMDMVVEGLHFEPGTAVRRVAWKAVARSLSDLAGMAADPRCSLAAVKFAADTPVEEARGLLKALAESAREMEAPLAGGDISVGGGPLCVTVTCLGTPGPAGSVLRSGARSGDSLCVTGSLGGSIRGRHLDFHPRTSEALELARRAELHALIDISDGLSTDALHIARASGVGVELEAARIPVSAAARELARETGRRPLWHALNDGEDYELLFSTSPTDAERLQEAGFPEVPVSVIGRVTEGRSEIVEEDGTRCPLEAEGWEHGSA